MPPHSSRNIAIILLVALSAVSTTTTGLASTTRGAIATASSDTKTTPGVDTIASGNYSTAVDASTTASSLASTATGDSTVASSALSTNAMAILSSMQAAFISLRVQLTESNAALA